MCRMLGPVVNLSEAISDAKVADALAEKMAKLKNLTKKDGEALLGAMRSLTYYIDSKGYVWSSMRDLACYVDSKGYVWIAQDILLLAAKAMKGLVVKSPVLIYKYRRARKDEGGGCVWRYEATPQGKFAALLKQHGELLSVFSTRR